MVKNSEKFYTRYVHGLRARLAGELEIGTVNVGRGADGLCHDGARRFDGIWMRLRADVDRSDIGRIDMGCALELPNSTLGPLGPMRCALELPRVPWGLTGKLLFFDSSKRSAGRRP